MIQIDLKWVFWVVIIYASGCSSGCQSGKELLPDMIISKSMTFANKTYIFPSSDSLDKPILTITGNDLVIDFDGATIVGNSNATSPDLFRGLGIKVEDGSNITIRNLKIKGFKIALEAENILNLTIENCDFSYNYRQRMKSIREREDLSDWLSYHNNESHQWKRYGAGIYLTNCDHALIRGNHASQNQNALLMVECDSSMVYNNQFVFNSGLGIGMYRSSDNKVLHNCLDFNVRGYSHGIYQRGQDSAGLLVYQQCMRNEFSNNSATHSGDGFFLWAGQYTMDTGRGGCNENLIAYNDFSFAPTNGIEVTFSSNKIYRNKMEGCRYGVWAGYSHHTEIFDNTFLNNQFGVAFEHGNTNVIAYNTFTGDDTGIKLWERASQPADWGFSIHRDISSRNYQLYGNSYNGLNLPLDIENTSDVDSATTVEQPDFDITELEDGLNAWDVYEMEGRDKIRVNEWGPYNFEYPQIWLTGIEDEKYTFQILGPMGGWKVQENSGFLDTNSNSGNIPHTLVLNRDRSQPKISIIMQYNGPPFKDQFGINHEGHNEVFTFKRYEKDISWDVRWYTYNTNYDPLNKNMSYQAIKLKRPEHQELVDDLAFTWWRSPGGEVDADNFLTFATSTVDFEPGKYQIQITSDDGLRFYLDGKRIIDHWDIHVPMTDRVEVELNGTHRFDIEHFEGGGFATLSFDIEPVDL